MSALTVPGGWWDAPSPGTDAVRSALVTLCFLAACLGAALCVAVLCAQPRTASCVKEDAGDRRSGAADSGAEPAAGAGEPAADKDTDEDKDE